MKSTIRVDFRGLDVDGTRPNQFEPVIRVNLEDSEDVRDGLLKSFFQSLGGESSWLAVDFQQYVIDGIKQPKRITLSPIFPSDLKATAEIILNRIKVPYHLLENLNIAGDDYEILWVEYDDKITVEPLKADLFKLNLLLGNDEEGNYIYKCNQANGKNFIFKKLNLVN